MKALILGCGYLGRRVASSWIQSGNNVFAMTRSKETMQKFLEDGIQPMLGDVCDFSSLGKLPEVDVVLHAIGFDRLSGKTQQEVTVDGIRNVLDLMADRCQRFIYVSSTSVYGQSSGEWVDEKSECCPTQAGGQLNLEAEHRVIDAFATRKDRSVTVLRLAGIYGPDRLLSRIESLRSGAAISGRGDSWLNLIHVDDAAKAVIACTKDVASKSIYNVVDDQPVERSDYFGLLAKAIGAPTPKFDPSQQTARGSGGLNKRCSNHLIRTALDWSPTYSTIEAGLPASIEASKIVT